MWETLLSTIVGGVIGLIGSAIGWSYQRKIAHDSQQYERNMRLAEKREELYLSLSGVIDNIPIPINSSTGKIDAHELEKHLQCLADAVEENKAAMALYADQGIRNDLLHLNSQILDIIESEEMQKIDFSSREAIENNPMFKAAKQAKSILQKMRKDISE